MAQQVGRTGALDLLEHTVGLLRETPFETFVCHWLGSVPFALALLFFWFEMTHLRAVDDSAVRDALLLAGVLVWMNCWRTVFAGRLRRQLSRAVEERWTVRRVARLVMVQTVACSIRLVATPAAALALLPTAWTTAFFRTLTVVEGPDAFARARRLAGYDARQNWLVLGYATFLFVVLWLNVAITLALLPQLVRILTGYESVFSRSGAYLVLNPLFLILSFSATWLLFDPFFQAVYCVRAFYAESLATGEDIRAALQTITRVAAGVVVLGALLMPAVRADVPPPDLDRSIQETLKSPEYNWRLAPVPQERKDKSWLVKFTDSLIAQLGKIFRFIGDRIADLIDWLRGSTRPLDGGGARLPGRGLHWSVYAVAGGILVIAAIVAWRLRTAGARKRAVAAPVEAVPVDAHDESVSADRLPEDEWFALAEEYRGKGDYRGALRALYLGNLAWLGRAEWIAIHSGKTNREYEVELRRRARHFPDALGLFGLNVAAFELVWYGLREAGVDDLSGFRERVQRMKEAMA